MTRIRFLIAGTFLGFAAAAVLLRPAPSLALAAFPAPQAASEMLIQVHGSHCDYRYGHKKGKRGRYTHRHANRCRRKHGFGIHLGPTYYRGYGDPDAYVPRHRRPPVRRRCWYNQWNELVCAGR